jgi:hypothetical protein
MEYAINAIYTRSPRVAYRRIGESFVLVNLQDNRILRLNDTGTEIWGLLDGRDVAQVAACICKMFDAPSEVVQEDTRAFLELLRSRGLVELAEEG